MIYHWNSSYLSSFFCCRKIFSMIRGAEGEGLSAPLISFCFVSFTKLSTKGDLVLAFSMSIYLQASNSIEWSLQAHSRYPKCNEWLFWLEKGNFHAYRKKNRMNENDVLKWMKARMNESTYEWKHVEWKQPILLFDFDEICLKRLKMAKKSSFTFRYFLNIH